VDKLCKKVDNCMLFFDECGITFEKNGLPLSYHIGETVRDTGRKTGYGKTTGY
jgi:hypothetical protein